MLATSRILAVDDDEDDIQLLQDAFAEIPNDAQLITLHTTDEFFLYLFPGHTLAEHWINAVPAAIPDLILLDLNMPKLNGLEVLRLVRQNEQLRQCKVVMLTTSLNPGDRQSCKIAGADLYLVKPSSFSGLVEICNVLLNKILPASRSEVMEVSHVW